MKIDAEMVQRWLHAYTHAWITYDPEEIGTLCTSDASDARHPWMLLAVVTTSLRAG